MGKYIDWSDVTDRYPEIATLQGSDEFAENYVVYAEGLVEGLLADYYTLPFSNNNLTVKDLAIEAAYFRAGRFKLENATTVKSDFYIMIDQLMKGNMNMISSSGDVLEGNRKSAGIYSSTQSYHSAFGIDDPVNWDIDSDYICDTQDSRL